MKRATTYLGILSLAVLIALSTGGASLAQAADGANKGV
jgi:hypothetical protein